MTRVVRRLFALSFACTCELACSSAPQASALPPVVQVPLPSEPDDSTAPAPTSKFACEPETANLSRRVWFRVKSAASDGQSATKETRASYAIHLSPGGHDAPASARVVLESLTTGGGEAQSAWNTALDRQWVRLGVPFTVTRQGETWCFAGNDPCSDPDQAEISAAVGETIELLDLAQLEPQLDGKPSDGQLELTLPEAILKRLGLGVVQSLDSFGRARQVKPGFPARFETRSEAIRTEGNARSVRASIEIDQHCRLRSLKAELLSLRAEESGGSKVIHYFTWRFEPLP